jgi:hypothetical protein
MLIGINDEEFHDDVFEIKIETLEKKIRSDVSQEITYEEFIKMTVPEIMHSTTSSKSTYGNFLYVDSKDTT